MPTSDHFTVICAAAALRLKRPTATPSERSFFQTSSSPSCRTGAPVVLQVIDSPGSPGPRILFFVAVAGFETCAGFAARSGIDTDLETLGMYIIRKRFHVRELLVGLYVSIFVALGFPGVVD